MIYTSGPPIIRWLDTKDATKEKTFDGNGFNLTLSHNSDDENTLDYW